MYNYFKLFWGGALLHYPRWLYTSNNNWVMVGVLLTISSVLFLFFKAAVILGVITLLYWGYVVLKPEYRYILKLSDNSRLFLLLYCTEKYRKPADKKKSSSLLYAYTETDNKKVAKKTFHCTGYDDSLKDCGLFLVNTHKNLWTLISADYPQGIELGHQIQNNLFSSGVVLNFLNGREIISIKAERIKMPPFGLTYDKNKAVYRCLGKDKEKFSELRAPMLLMAVTDKRAKLFAFGITEGHVPLVFQVFVPYVYPPHCPVYDRGVLPISVNQEDGSFMLL